MVSAFYEKEETIVWILMSFESNKFARLRVRDMFLLRQNSAFNQIMSVMPPDKLAAACCETKFQNKLRLCVHKLIHLFILNEFAVITFLFHHCVDSLDVEQ